MVALVCGAVRARTAQALTVLILTALVTAVAGPWYAISGRGPACPVDHLSVVIGPESLSGTA